MRGTMVELAKTSREALNNLRFQLWRYRFVGEPTLEKPIFMIGCPRSGTTIAQKLFATHPWVADWSEAGQIWDPVDYYNPEADHAWDADRVTEADARRLHARFEWYRQTHKKQRFLNKHPRNSVRLDYIRTVFPDAFFIHVIREGRAVVSSILTKIQGEPDQRNIPFGNFCKPPHWREYLHDDPVEQAAFQWREITRYILDRRDTLGNRYHEFRYEDMCARPQEVFEQAFRNVDLPISEVILSTIPQRLKNMNHKYGETLSQEQIHTINAIQGDLLRQLGYEV
jgi:hypothetical protein